MEVPSTNTVVELLTEIRDELRTLNERLATTPGNAPKRPRKPKATKAANSDQDPNTSAYVPTELDRAKALRIARELGFKKTG